MRIRALPKYWSKLEILKITLPLRQFYIVDKVTIWSKISLILALFLTDFFILLALFIGLYTLTFVLLLLLLLLLLLADFIIYYNTK